MRLAITMGLSVLGGMVLGLGFCRLRRESNEQTAGSVPLRLLLVVVLGAISVGAVLSSRSWDTQHFASWLQGGMVVVLFLTLAAVVEYTWEARRLAEGTYKLVEAGERRLQNEYRSLLFVMYGDSVLAFERCSIIYEKYKPLLLGQGKEEAGEKGPSRSSLPAFPATCDLKRFATICQDPDALGAVVHLNWRYFQIERHIETAAALQIRCDALTSQRTTLQYVDELSNSRLHMDENCKTGLHFFESYYDRLKDDTVLLRDKAREHRSKEDIREFECKFDKAKCRTLDIHKTFEDIRGAGEKPPPPGE